MELIKIPSCPPEVETGIPDSGNWYRVEIRGQLIGFVFVKQDNNRDKRKPDLHNRTTVYFDSVGSRFVKTFITYPNKPIIKTMFEKLVMVEV